MFLNQTIYLLDHQLVMNNEYLTHAVLPDDKRKKEKIASVWLDEWLISFVIHTECVGAFNMFLSVSGFCTIRINVIQKFGKYISNGRPYRDTK